jgi:hypothetical protein
MSKRFFQFDNFQFENLQRRLMTSRWARLFCVSVLALIVGPDALLGQASHPTSEVERPEFSILVQDDSAQNPPPQPTASQDQSADAGQDIDRLLTKLVLENIPHNFEETKDWGAQDERWNGVKFRREGLKIETKRRKKLVNHGTWKKYSAQLRNPTEEFTVQIKNMRETEDDKLAFDVHFLAHLDIQGRQAKWVKGVQLYSIGVEGHTQVRLVVSIELEVKMGGSVFPPDLVFVPVATDADLVVDEFRIDRVGKAGGEFAQQVTKGVRTKLDEKINEKKQKLLKKINKSLTKQQDKLRISIADAVESKWTKAAKAFLPDEVKDSLGE